ncbi:hypothetical protein OE88DRAFT_262570 [Heliocybe sulcata]|uniref:DUF6533 domain-containing protein n=1 Tax=Heliocybe sulcata TaxID=5364 RepID=A0A5C3MYS8_9AGAM|nr:hypothetical protein OE88DRAFT_262570 [Heliocybe sulcata]
MQTSCCLSAMDVGSLEYFRIARTREYSTAIALTSYAYHFACTVPSEITIVWATPWTRMKTLYFINRYLGLFVVIVISVGTYDTSLICTHFYGGMRYICLLSIGVVEVILQLRLHALFERRLSIVILVTALFVLTVSASIILAVMVGLGAEGMDEITKDIRENGVCSMGLDYSLKPIFAFDGCILLLLAYRFVQHAHSRSRMHVPTFWGYGGRIFAIFTRDSIWYYLSVLATFSIRGVGSAICPAIEDNIPIVWAFVIPTASASSMILNMGLASAQLKLGKDNGYDPPDVIELSVLHVSGS